MPFKKKGKECTTRGSLIQRKNMTYTITLPLWLLVAILEVEKLFQEHQHLPFIISMLKRFAVDLRS